MRVVMRETGSNGTPSKAGPKSLLSIIREVRNAQADRSDSAEDMRRAARTRLELLVEQLQPVLDDVDRDDPRFDFALSNGMQPRFWIDAVAHVAMGRDQRHYRFLRDTRAGRTVLADTTDVESAAQAVSRYIAERIVEREKQIAGEVIAYEPATAPSSNRSQPERTRTAWHAGAIFFLIGALVGLIVALAILWSRQSFA